MWESVLECGGGEGRDVLGEGKGRWEVMKRGVGVGECI